MTCLSESNVSVGLRCAFVSGIIPSSENFLFVDLVSVPRSAGKALAKIL